MSADRWLGWTVTIDAGRVHIHGLDEIGKSIDDIQNGDQVRSQWNSLLATKGCLSHLPQAVHNFVIAHNCGVDRTQHLSEAIFKSDFVRQYQQWISSRYQWLYQLKPDEKSWQLISADSPVLALPPAPRDEQNRAWSVLPKLNGLSEQGYIFYDQSQVHVLNERHKGWNDELLLDVLNIHVSSVFYERTFCTYLNNFLSLEDVKKTEAVTEHLINLARAGLKLSSDKLFKAGITRFLEFIPPGQCVVLQKVKMQGLWTRLAEVKTRFLIVPKEVAPERDEREETANLLIDDAKLLLQAVDKVLGDESKVNHHGEAQDLVEEILKRFEPNEKERLINECSDFRLFKVFDLAKNKDVFLAKSNLRRFANAHSLFRFQAGRFGSAERFGLGHELLKAFESCNIYYIDSANFDFAFSKSDKVPLCDAKACLEFIHLTKPVLANSKNRTDLVIKLSANSSFRPPEKHAFRYVLHGNLDHYDSDDALLAVETRLGGVWQKLASAIYRVGNDEWRLVDTNLIDDLSHKTSSELNINILDVNQILTGLKKRLQNIDFQSLQLERDEQETILSTIDDSELWKQLPFHQTVSGNSVTITEKCYLDTDLDIPDSLSTQFTRIRKSSNPKVAKQQTDWIRPLDQNALVAIILSSQNPDKFYLLIMDQLSNLALDDELKKRLKQTAWLVTTTQQKIKPEDIIVINGLEDEVKRLTAECDAGYFVPEDIHPEIVQHPAFEQLKSYFSCKREGLECLILMLGESEAYVIGELPCDVNDLLEFAALVSDDLDLHGWKILSNKQVKALLKEDVENSNDLLKPLLQPLTEDRYLIVLERLIQCHKAVQKNNRPKVLKLFNDYLSLFACCPNTLIRLKNIELFSQGENWVSAEQLCVDVVGVADDALLDKEQASAIQAIIYTGGEQRSEQNQTLVVDESLLLQSTPPSLMTYFRDWDGRVESELIGFFISLLGGNPGVEQVAEKFLGKRSLEGVRNELDWHKPTKSVDKAPLFEDSDQHQAIKKMEFLISVEAGEKAQVRSIFGDTIEVFLHEKPSSLIVNHRFLGQYRVSFQLRKLNFTDWSESELSSLLRSSAEFVLKTIYEQHCALDKIWGELGQSDQLDIAVARGLILDELPANLRQLSLQKSELKQYLKDYDQAKHKKKELEIASGDTQRPIQEINEALQKMQNLLINDNETQLAVLHAIKNKIINYQYQIDSVPFELFQNADDAVIEYAEMQAYPGQLDVFNNPEWNDLQCQCHVIEENQNILFVHWGRAINYFRGAEGFPGKERGFDRDLEKMLLMNTSDKQAENQVTGKFGLGFKSVYLISDKPKILSGRLGIEIFAAMLPEKLQEHDRNRLKSKVISLNDSKLTATVFELPLADSIESEDVLTKFKCYVPILVAFSRAIKAIKFNEKQAVSWHEKIVLNSIPELRKGSVILRGKNTEAVKLTFNNDRIRANLLFALGARGFEDFPNKVDQLELPKIWVLAPTHDSSSIGFMINAEFDVDMGRLQLAHQSAKNDQIMLHLGSHLVRVVEQLDDCIQNDWQGLRDAFDLAVDVTPYCFWMSFWSVLVSSWVRKDDNKVHQLVRTILGSEYGSFISLLKQKSLFPSGLWGDYRQLLCLPNIRYVLKGILSQDKFFQQMHGQLLLCVKTHEMLHQDVQRDLDSLIAGGGTSDYQWSAFDLSVLAKKSFANEQVDISAASLWGEFFNDEVKQELDNTEERKKENQQLEKILSNFKFLNNDQQFKSVSELLDGEHGDSEEKLRSAFAPETRLLSKKYDENGAVFFRFSRPQMKADVSLLKQWALTAPHFEKQKGVLNYLLNGEKNDELAKQIKEVKQGTWLEKLNAESEHFLGWSKSDINMVLKGKLATDEQMENWKLPEVQDVAIEEPLNPGVVLSNVYHWWLENKEAYLLKYDRSVYPEDHFPDLGDELEINRNGWMTLLFLASLHTLGRTKDAQHREAIRKFKSNGWWDVFVQSDPQESPEQWMRILDEYFEGQFYNNEYESWMMRFVSLYRFARWLDEYACSWLSIQQQSSFFSLGNVLNTATSAIHAGGGIRAPQIGRTLGIGANFIMRELIRHGILNGSAAIVGSEHCYVASKRVRELLNELGMGLDTEYAYPDQSKQIYHFIAKHLGKEKATFGMCFDIPFQMIARDIQLQSQLFTNTQMSFKVRDSLLLTSPSWAWDLIDDIPFYVSLVKDNHLPEPTVGYDLCDSDDTVLLELELAWEDAKVGIVIDDSDLWDELVEAEKNDWQIFSKDDLEYDLDRFLACFK